MASEQWTLEHIAAGFGSEPHQAEKSDSNHFMYFSHRATKDRTWKPPQEIVKITFNEFALLAYTQQLGGDLISSLKGLYYFIVSANEGISSTWISGTLSLPSELNPLQRNRSFAPAIEST